jgi:hypothetical protein
MSVAHTTHAHQTQLLALRAITEQVQWHPAATKPDCDTTVLCWGGEGFFCGWWDDDLGCWFDCSSGGVAEGVTHWANPEGPQS